MRGFPLPCVSRFGRLRTFEQRSKPSRIVSHDRSELIDGNPQSQCSLADRARSRKRCQTVALLHVWFLRRDINPGRFSPSPGPHRAERAFDQLDLNQANSIVIADDRQPAAAFVCAACCGTASNGLIVRRRDQSKIEAEVRKPPPTGPNCGAGCLCRVVTPDRRIAVA